MSEAVTISEAVMPRMLPPVGRLARLRRSVGGPGSVRLIGRHARLYKHMWLVFVSGAFEPLFYLLSVGIGLGVLVGRVPGPSGALIPYREFVAPGLLAVSSMNGAMYDSTFSVFFRLKYDKLYDAVLATPIRPAEVALGEIGWALLRGSAYAVAFTLVMLAMGLVHSWWAIFAVPVAVLIGFSFAAIGMTGTTYMKSWQDFDYVILASTPLFLFSATFYPLSVYPRAVQVVVEWTPLYQGVVLLRDLTVGVVGPGLVWRALYLGVLGVAGLYWSGRRIGKLLLVLGFVLGSLRRASMGVRWGKWGEVWLVSWFRSGRGRLRPMLQEQEAQTSPTPVVRVPSAYRDPVTWAIVTVVFGAYTVISVFRLLQLNPSSWDLGIFTEYVKQYAHFHPPIVNIRGAGTNLAGDHFSPAIVVLAPFFRVFPSAATLLVSQSLLVALSVFPVSQAARSLLGTGPARAIAIAYGFSWGMQQMVDFDFHEIALAVPLLAFALSAVVQGRVRAAVCWALPLVFVKEDQGFTVAALGLYLLISGLRTGPAPGENDRERMRAGQFLTIWGMAWSFLAIAVIIPHFNASHTYYYWGDGGAFGPGGHPSMLALFRQFFHAWPEKLQTLVLLFLPTAFVALRSPITLIAVPSLGLRFESSNSAYWGTAWHYNATVMPILFVAAIDGLVRIRRAMLEAEVAESSAGVGVTGDPDAAASEAVAAGAGAGGAGAGSGGEGSGPGGEGAGGPAVPMASAELADAAGGWRDWASGQVGWWRAAQAGALRYGAAMMVAVAAAMAFQYPVSGLWNGQTYRITPHVGVDNAAMAKVPDGATVLTTLNMLASLAARTDTYWIGNSGNPDAEYIVFDGPQSGYSPAITNVPAFIAGLYPGHTYTQIFSNDGVYVFHRTDG